MFVVAVSLSTDAGDLILGGDAVESCVVFKEEVGSANVSARKEELHK